MASPANASLMKRLNQLAVLRALRGGGLLSRAELAVATGLSQPAVTAIVRELMEQGLVRERGLGQSSGGRPPILLEFIPDALQVMGVTLIDTGIHLALANLDGEITREAVVALEPAGKLLTTLIVAMRNLLVAGPPVPLAAIGLGVPGILDRERGTVSHAPALRALHGLPLQRALVEAFDVPVALENDVNLMALGEQTAGGGRGKDHLVYLHFGLGVGAGLILEGRLYRGAHEAAGEVAFLPFGPIQSRSRSDLGPFEEYYSASALKRRLEALGESPPAEPIRWLRQAAAAGNRRAQGLFNDVCRHWAYALVSIAALLNPERILLAGDALQLGEDGLALLRQQVDRLVPVAPELAFAELGPKAGLLGAIALALQQIEMAPPTVVPTSST